MPPPLAASIECSLWNVFFIDVPPPLAAGKLSRTSCSYLRVTEFILPPPHPSVKEIYPRGAISYDQSASIFVASLEAFSRRFTHTLTHTHIHSHTHALTHSRTRTHARTHTHTHKLIMRGPSSGEQDKRA